MYIHSPQFTGLTLVGIVKELPIEGVSKLLGNDLTGDKVFPPTLATFSSLSENNTSHLESQYPGIFPACVVTRCMSKRVVQGEDQEISPRLADLELGKLFEEAEQISVGEKLASNGVNGPTVVGLTAPPVSKSRFIEFQAADPSLDPIFTRAITEELTDQEHPCFYLQSGLLLRKFCPAEAPADKPWLETHQLVVPTPLRQEITNVAHNGVGGHLEARKTYARILAHFFWPKLKKDISEYCYTCHTSQVSGNYNPSVKLFPLQPIPVIYLLVK